MTTLAYVPGVCQHPRMIRLAALTITMLALTGCGGEPDTTATATTEAETTTTTTVPTRTCDGRDFWPLDGDIYLDTPMPSCTEAVDAGSEIASQLADPAPGVERFFAESIAVWEVCEAMQTGVERQAMQDWEREFAERLDADGICLGDPTMVVGP